MSGYPQNKHPTPPFPAQTQTYPGQQANMEPAPNDGAKSYVGSGKLKDKVALITGGDSGIGRAVAIAFAKEGADVAISYLSDTETEDAQTTLKEIEIAGRAGLLLPGDIQEEAQCQKLVDETINKFGKLDILINNAAFQMFHESILDITTAEIERTFRTNIFAMFFLVKAALKRLQPGGAIINTASVQAFSPSPTLTAYAATKGAIITFTKAVAQEAAEYGVRVNAVAPGPVWTPLIPASTKDGEQVANFGTGSLWKRPAQPVELAPVYVLLASDEGAYITGEVYPVTGSIKVI